MTVLMHCEAKTELNIIIAYPVTLGFSLYNLATARLEETRASRSISD